ncbi:MAG: hypothetical protein QXJ64_09690 [Thermosphaera sp.]
MLTVNTPFLINNNNGVVEEIGSTVFGLRVPVSVYNYYKRKLTGEEQEFIREAVKQFFIHLVSNAKGVQLAFESRQTSFNVNLNVIQNNIVSRGENAYKLKREIDKLSRELERTLAENIELKKEIESLRVENEKLRNASKNPELDSVKAEVDRLKSRLEDAVFSIDVAVKCLSRGDCDIDKLHEFLKSQLDRVDRLLLRRNQDLAESVLKSLKR